MMLIDMPMPKTCGQCFCAMMDYDYNTVRCRFNYDLRFDANSRDYSKRRLDGCPLHEVTDHDTISRQATERGCGMTNREAIDVLKVLKAVWEEDNCEGEAEALQMAINALEQQNVTDHDTVSRKQALDALKALPVTLDAGAVQRCIETVSNLPPSPTPSRQPR